jgi:branched-subunit amino acid ABC-type transport system permease component
LADWRSAWPKSAVIQTFLTFALVILALALRPDGLFGSKTLVKV